MDPYGVFYASTSTAAVPETASNDTAATAMAAPNCDTPVAASLSALGDADYYSVALTAGQTLFVAADADPERDFTGTLELNVEVRSPADAVLLTLDVANNSPLAQAAGFVAPTAGTYFVKTSARDIGDIGNYDLLIAPEGPAPSAAAVLADTPADVRCGRQHLGGLRRVRDLRQRAQCRADPRALRRRRARLTNRSHPGVSRRTLDGTGQAPSVGVAEGAGAGMIS